MVLGYNMGIDGSCINNVDHKMTQKKNDLMKAAAAIVVVIMYRIQSFLFAFDSLSSYSKTIFPSSVISSGVSGEIGLSLLNFFKAA